MGPMKVASAWLPAGILTVGCLLNLSVAAQRVMPLADSLSTLPASVAGYPGRTEPINPAEVRVAGTSASILRIYARDSLDNFSLYVGYYAQQRQGQTIHSPKNCLPGGGWEPVESSRATVAVAGGTIVANRWLIAKNSHKALVFYWYQGRGRTEANEYQVKLDLIRDAALRRRSEEALVRIVVPITTDAAAADTLARRAVRELAPHITRILPS
jgi:EpsI family protein